MTALRWLMRIVLALASAVALLAFVSRFADGPLVGPIPGGPLASGEEVSEPVRDWAFVEDVGEIELQLASQTTSRTTWVLLLEGQAYVPCSLGFPPGKSWYKDAAADGRATLRIEGKRYPVLLTKLDDAAVQQMEPLIRSEITRKYDQAPPSDAGVWLFRIESR